VEERLPLDPLVVPSPEPVNTLQVTSETSSSGSLGKLEEKETLQEREMELEAIDVTTT
jgi:hypothetical protein